jgi:hypothetical protein
VSDWLEAELERVAAGGPNRVRRHVILAETLEVEP